jgi:hypothetical protein
LSKHQKLMAALAVASRRLLDDPIEGPRMAEALLIARDIPLRAGQVASLFIADNCPEMAGKTALVQGAFEKVKEALS